MTILTKKSISVLTLSAAIGISLAVYTETATAALAGNTATNFTARVQIISDNTCTLTVSPPAATAFTATWTGNVAANTSNIVLNTSVTDPIKIVANGGTTCSLNTIKISATMGGMPNPAAYHTSESHAQLYPFGSSGGSWSIIPAVTRISLFTDSAFATPSPAVITGVTASGLSKAQAATPVFTVGATGNFTSTLGGTGLIIADTYYGGSFDGLGLTTVTGTPGTVTFKTNAPAETYKSAMIYIGGAIGVNPSAAATGVTDLKAAANGDTAVMPFTVTISEA